MLFSGQRRWKLRRLLTLEEIDGDGTVLQEECVSGARVFCKGVKEKKEVNAWGMSCECLFWKLSYLRRWKRYLRNYLSAWCPFPFWSVTSLINFMYWNPRSSVRCNNQLLERFKTIKCYRSPAGKTGQDLLHLLPWFSNNEKEEMFYLSQNDLYKWKNGGCNEGVLVGLVTGGLCSRL